MNSENVSGTGPRRVLVIGLDAFEFSLLMQGMDEGSLPHLARLRDTAAWGPMTQPSGFGNGAVWPSIATGVSPAKHSRYYYRQVEPGSYEAHRFEAEEFQSRPVWERLSAAGHRVAVYDVPAVPLSTEIDGIMAVSWMSHDSVYRDGLRTWPASYATELTGRFGADPAPRCDRPGGRTDAEQREFLQTLRDRIDQRVRCTEDQWADPEVELLITVFGEPHCAGHQTWHIHDLAHPQHDPRTRETLGDPILEMNERLDHAVGHLLEQVDDDTTAIVVGGTGMGPNYTGNGLLDDVLRRLEGATPTTRHALTRRAKQAAKRWLPQSLRQRGGNLKRKVEEGASATDRARRRAFAVPHNDIAGAIRLNVVGREAHGLLRPEQVDAYVDELRTRLLELRNADTGGPVVDQVVRLADEEEGQWLDHMPDMWVIWNREAPIDRVTSPAVGTVEYQNRGSRTGDHSPESFFFARGPGIRPQEVTGVSIYDIAPTLAALFDIGIEDTDGRVIAAVVPTWSSRPTLSNP